MNTFRPARRYRIATACVALAACQDAPTASPALEAPPVAAASLAARTAESPLRTAPASLESLRDALTRVHPTLAVSEQSAAIATGLRQAIGALERGDKAQAHRALEVVEELLQRIATRDGNTMSPDLDVIRHAVRTSHPSLLTRTSP